MSMLTPQIRIDAVRVVHDDGLHNAFTDLCSFGGRYYLTFRSCPDGHMIHPTSRIVVLSSSDAVSWERVHSFAVPGRDVRDLVADDPHFLGGFAEYCYVLPGPLPRRSLRRLEAERDRQGGVVRGAAEPHSRQEHQHALVVA